MEKVRWNIEQCSGDCNYESLKDKPQVNGVELSGNKTAKNWGLHLPVRWSSCRRPLMD